MAGYSILKRPFEMQVHLEAANFCILVCSEYEEKKVLFNLPISEMPENKYFLYLYVQALLFVNQGRKAEKQISGCRRRTLYIFCTDWWGYCNYRKNFSQRQPPPKVNLSHPELYKAFLAFFSLQTITKVFNMKNISRDLCNSALWVYHNVSSILAHHPVAGDAASFPELHTQKRSGFLNKIWAVINEWGIHVGQTFILSIISSICIFNYIIKLVGFWNI